MGLYNYVNFETTCPVCQAMIKQFQTKEGECNMDMVDFNQVNNFYAICPNCQTFVEFYYSPENKERTIEDYKMRVIKLGRNGY
jgi:C4-type Zn-finger protein